MAKPKVGETRGWNEKTGTGYKWNGKKWVMYKNNKPFGPLQGHGGLTGNVDIAGGTMSALGRAARTVTRIPSKEEVTEAREAGERYKTNNTVRTATKRKSKENGKKETFSMKEDSKKKEDSKTRKPHPFKPSNSTTKPKSPKEEKKKVTSTRPKPGSAGSRIQQTLKDSGFTQEGLDKLTDKHAAWKKAKKQGTLGDWEKTYHPDRTPQYTNKKKKTNKSRLQFSKPL